MCEEIEGLELEEDCCCDNKQLALDMLEMFIDNGIVQFNVGNNAANVDECLAHYKKIFATLDECSRSDGE